MSDDIPPPGRVITNQACAQFLRYAADTSDLISLAQGGAHALSNIQKQLQDLGGLGNGSIDEKGALANREIENDFPLLHAHVLVGAWGALESAIDDVCVGWLVESQGQTARPAMEGIKVKLPDVFFLDGTERWRWLLEQFKGHQGSSLKAGVGQFESPLAACGVQGEVDPSIRQVLFYAKSMRNVVAHRGGRIDKKFADQCHRLNPVPGEVLQVRGAHLQSTLTAMVVYVDDVRARIASATGEATIDVELPPWIESREQVLEEFHSASGVS